MHMMTPMDWLTLALYLGGMTIIHLVIATRPEHRQESPSEKTEQLQNTPMPQAPRSSR